MCRCVSAVHKATFRLPKSHAWTEPCACTLCICRESLGVCTPKLGIAASQSRSMFPPLKVHGANQCATFLFHLPFFFPVLGGTESDQKLMSGDAIFGINPRVADFPMVNHGTFIPYFLSNHSFLLAPPSSLLPLPLSFSLFLSPPTWEGFLSLSVLVLQCLSSCSL